MRHNVLRLVLCRHHGHAVFFIYIVRFSRSFLMRGAEAVLPGMRELSVGQKPCKRKGCRPMWDDSLLGETRSLDPLSVFLLLAVIDIVALCGGENGLEVGVTVLHEDIVPLEQLLDVAVVHAVLVEVGQHLREIVAQLLA